MASSDWVDFTGRRWRFSRVNQTWEVEVSLGVWEISALPSGGLRRASIADPDLDVQIIETMGPSGLMGPPGPPGTVTLLTPRAIDKQIFDGSRDITVIAPGTHVAPSKITPIDADEIPLVDSGAGNVLKKLTWANLTAAIKSYYDSAASVLTNKTIDGTTNTLLNISADSVVNGIANQVYTASEKAKLSEIVKGTAQLHHDFTLKSNGAVAATADSGQTWTQIRSRSGAAPAIAAGRFVDPDTASGSSASYLEADLGATVTHMQADFDMSAAGSTNTSTVAIIAFATPLPNAGGLLTSPAPDSPCHLVIGATFIEYQVIVSGSITSLGAFALDMPITTQLAHVEVTIDKANSKAYVLSPDGKVYRFTDSAIGSIVAPWATCETFLTAPNTDRRPQIATFQADATSLRNVPGQVYVPAARLLAAGQSQDSTGAHLLHPSIDYVVDKNGNPTLSMIPSVGAVNYAQLFNSPTGSPVVLVPEGSDPNISWHIEGKGDGSVDIVDAHLTNPTADHFRDSNGNVILLLTGGASAVNYVQMLNGATGTGPVIIPAGGDTNADLNLYAKGTGKVKANGSPVLTTATTGALNPKDFGAVADGVTDDSAAFLAMYATAVAGSVSTFALGGQRSIHSIYIPAGTYLLTQSGSLIADLAIAFTAGIKFYGDGLEATKIVFSPSADDGYLVGNQNDLAFLTFEDMSFWGDGAHATTATFFRSNTTNGSRAFRFNRVNWAGTWQYGFDLTGTNNNDTMSWAECGIYGDWTSFLHVPPSVGAGYGDQFVFFTFLNVEAEYVSGDFIDMAYGGCVLILNGSFVHIGNGDQSTSSPQCFFKLGVGASPPGGHSVGAQNFTMIGGRVEHRHHQSSLIKTEWTGGNITFTGVIADPMQPFLTSANTLESAEFGSAAVVATNSGRPNVLFTNCILLGYHKYHYGAGSNLDRANTKYDNCTIVSHTRAVDFIVYADDSSLGLMVGRMPVRFVDCHSSIFQFDPKEIFDCTVGFPNVGAVPIERKAVPIQHPWGGPPYSGGPGHLNLPLNAIITRVFAVKAAAGVTAVTTFTYTLTDADGTVIAVVSGGGRAWNAGWSYDSGPLYHQATTTNKRTLTLTAANMPDTTADCLIFVEYLA